MFVYTLVQIFSLVGSKTIRIEIMFAILSFISSHFSISFISLSMSTITETKLSWTKVAILICFSIEKHCFHKFISFRCSEWLDWYYSRRKWNREFYSSENIFLHLYFVSDLENASTMQNISRSKISPCLVTM